MTQMFGAPAQPSGSHHYYSVDSLRKTVLIAEIPMPTRCAGGRAVVDVAQVTVCSTQFSDVVLLLLEGDANARTVRVDLTLRDQTNARVHVTSPGGRTPARARSARCSGGCSGPTRRGGRRRGEGGDAMRLPKRRGRNLGIPAFATKVSRPLAAPAIAAGAERSVPAGPHRGELWRRWREKLLKLRDDTSFSQVTPRLLWFACRWNRFDAIYTPFIGFFCSLHPLSSPQIGSWRRSRKRKCHFQEIPERWCSM